MIQGKCRGDKVIQTQNNINFADFPEAILTSKAIIIHDSKAGVNTFCYCTTHHPVTRDGEDVTL